MVMNEIVTQLIICDIVVWNGVIAKWGAVKGHYTSGDLIRLATDDEVETFKEKQQNGNI